MKKFFISLICLLVIFPLLFSKKVLAAALQITELGTMNVTSLDLGGNLKTYTYSGGTFELAGLASPSAIISVTIDNSTQTATADTSGSWSTLISALTEGQHNFDLTSSTESLDFVLTVGSTSTASGETATAATSSSTLPAAGSITTNILFLALAMLSVGSGLALKVKQS